MTFAAGLAAAELPGGVIVESVGKSYAAHRAGLAAGDLLVSWRREASPPANPQGATGEFRVPFDVQAVEIEQTPRGKLTIVGVRNGETFATTMPPGRWVLSTRPRLGEEERREYLAGKTLLGTAAAGDGMGRWLQFARGFRKEGEHLAVCWLYSEMAGFYARGGDRTAARMAFETAIREAKIDGGGMPMALLEMDFARLLEQWKARAEALEHYQAALDILRCCSPSLTAARVLTHLGTAAWEREDLDEAEDYYRQALAIRRQAAPESIDVANGHHNLAIVAETWGDLAGAEAQYRQAREIDEKIGIDGPESVSRLSNFGILLGARGDLAQSEAVLQKALAAQEKLAPQNQMIRVVLNALGTVAHSRGDLQAAEIYYRRSLETGGADPLEFRNALVFSNLGDVALSRADLASAEQYFRQALSIFHRVRPDSLHVANMWSKLGELAFQRGDLAAAEGFQIRALALQRKVAPTHLQAARSLHRLGTLAFDRGDLSVAETYFRKALRIREEFAPGSLAEAESSRGLGMVYRRMQRPDRALTFFRRAVAALEARRERLGGADGIRTRVAAHYADFYRDTIEVLLDLQEPEEAFRVLERYRARGFLALLTERDLVFDADIPTALERERRRANLRYDQAYGELSQQEPGWKSRQDERIRELKEARLWQAEVAAKIRLASPRLAALKYPQPLDLPAVQGALDPGTLLLSYFVGPESSYLFAVGPDPGEFAVFPLATDEDLLGREAGRYRRALEQGRVDRRMQVIWLHARRLSGWLLAPVRERIARAERLLIVADGPLHSLPFAALADPAESSGRHFLVEAKPVYTAASATVFARLKGERRPRSGIRLAAFGDPTYPVGEPPEGSVAPEMRAVLKNGFRLPPVPSTRAEVEALRRLYPGTSRIFLGPEATEARAKEIGQEAEILHFACHGLLDDRSPLDSALALTIPEPWRDGEDNGLLQVWEIFEQVRIDADLVTLSACSTGLGELAAGEGLLGLSRAFQYAGARSVLASLWSLSDPSTAELMGRFYGYLKAGESKAEALRHAQIDFLQASSLSHPFHWAGFQLLGDWY